MSLIEQWLHTKQSPMALFKSYIVILLLLLTSTLSFAKDNCSTSIDGIYAIRGSATEIPVETADWSQVTLPDTWLKRWPDYDGGVWYRINWQLNCQNKNLHHESLAFTVNRITMAGKAYVNQDLIWQDQSLVEPFSRSWNKPIYGPIPPSSIQLGENFLYIYVAGAPIDKPGLGEVTLGQSKKILNIYEDDTWSQRTLFIINISLSITLGAICSCIWFFRRKEKAFGWFGLCTIFWSGFIYNILATETSPLPNSYTVMQVNIAFFLGYIYCFCLFTWRFLNRSYPKIERIFLIINIILTICAFFAPYKLLPIVIVIAFYINFIIFIINLFVVFYISSRTNSLETWLLAFAILGCIVLGIIDLLTLLNILPYKNSILPYSSSFIAVFLTIILSLHLTQSLKKIESFNDDLNQQIIQTTQDYKSSLQQQYQLALKNDQLQTRLKLSHELHDGLGSTLTQVITSVNYHKERALNKAEVLGILKILRNDLRQIVDVFKGHQQPLPQSPVLWLAPLRHRFNILFHELSIDAVWLIESEWKDEPTWPICSVLYRVLEEALSNIIKHSQANSVEVSFQYHDDVMILQIKDNGVGFDVESIYASGVTVGLQSIKSRVEQLEGQLIIQSEPKQTVITIIL